MSLRTHLKLGGKEYRDEFFKAHSYTGITMQIRIMREARGWSQAELARKAGMTQSMISRLENENWEGMTLKTLFRVASAFDVAMLARFMGVDEFLSRTEDLSVKALNAPSFESPNA